MMQLELMLFIVYCYKFNFMVSFSRLLVPLAFLFLFMSCGNDDDNKGSALEGCCTNDYQLVDMNPGKIYVPNIFTPDNNGVNDIFFPRSDDGIQLIESFEIRSLGGTLIYSANSILPNGTEFGWDGTLSDGTLIRGLFNYEISIRNNDGDRMEINGMICSFPCDRDDRYEPKPESLESCAFPSQHDGNGGFDQFIFSGEEWLCSE